MKNIKYKSENAKWIGINMRFDFQSRWNESNEL